MPPKTTLITFENGWVNKRHFQPGWKRQGYSNHDNKKGKLKAKSEWGGLWKLTKRLWNLVKSIDKVFDEDSSNL